MLDNLTTKQKRIVAIIGIIVAIGIIYYIYYGRNTKEQVNIEENILITDNSNNQASTTQQAEEIEEMVIIHITGAVKNPGIVKLKEGSRIEDAIEKAGGLTENADITEVNLAYILEDGIKLKIPSITDEAVTEEDILIENNGEDIIEEAKGETIEKTGVVNINKANQTELETLPGIGPSLANKIVAYRKENGKFENIEDIKNVSGIGDSKFENIREFICIK